MYGNVCKRICILAIKICSDALAHFFDHDTQTLENNMRKLSVRHFANEAFDEPNEKSDVIVGALDAFCLKKTLFVYGKIANLTYIHYAERSEYCFYEIMRFFRVRRAQRLAEAIDVCGDRQRLCSEKWALQLRDAHGAEKCRKSLACF